MKKGMKRLIVGLAAIVALVSCAPTKYVAPDLGSTLDKVAIVTPFTYIEFLDQNNLKAYDDSLSGACAHLITEALAQSGLPTTQVIPIDFQEADAAFPDALASLRDVNPKYAGQTHVPPVLRNLLLDNGARYGVIVFANGFSRDRKGYAKAAALGVGLAVLTAVISMGTVSAYAIPVKSEMSTWIGIVDAEEDCFVFYNARYEEGAEPAIPHHVTRQIQKLLKPIQ